MNKNYHEHCKEEHEEALCVLKRAEALTKDNITLTCITSSGRKIILTAPETRLKATLRRLKRKGIKVIPLENKNKPKTKKS